MKYLKKKRQRPEEKRQELEERLREILRGVREESDSYLIQLNEKFDGCKRQNLRVSRDEIDQAYDLVDPKLIEDMRSSYDNIKNFALKQKESMVEIHDFEAVPGVFLSQRLVPIENVACYVPGGNYPFTPLP